MAPTELQQHTGAMPRNASASAASTAAPNTTAIVIGASIGALIALACIFITARIVRTRRAHRKAISAIEEGHAVPGAVRQNMSEVPRPLSGCSMNRFRPLNTQGGWDALGSNDTINEPRAVAQSGKRKRDTAPLSKRVKSHGIPLKPFKHLSAIIESPRAPQESMPMPTAKNVKISPKLQLDCSITAIHPAHREEVLSACDSPKPAVVPSFAIRSPGSYGAAIANNEHKFKAPRSVSTGVLTDYVSDGAVFGSLEPMPNMSKRRGPPLHIRSVSLGAPPSRPPSGPVPPLPVISPLETDWDEARKGMCISRMSSSSSNGSTGSSVLVVSPILERHNTDDPVVSPTVEEVVDEDDGAMKTVPKRQWQDPPVTVTRPTSNMKAGRHSRARSSVRARIVRSSTDSALTHLRQTSSSSTSSCGSGGNRLSIPQICSAERVSLSRVSSSNSLCSTGGIQKITTPTKQARRVSSVSAYGSPVERRRASALRDISGNAVLRKNTPTREASQSTINSGRSSNGNPFQWDTQSANVLPKPSALKGSPNARKNHKRQKSCVRISTLTPEVLGPDRSRSASPSGLMHEIKEERESDEIVRQPSHRESSMYLARGAKPPNASASTGNLRVQTLRASLTPSSPTLSTWNAYRDTSGLPSQPSDSNMTTLNLTLMDASRPVSRQSDRSFSIPKFPSPARKSQATMSPVAIDTAPMPEFAAACPSSDEGEETHSSSPFALDMSSEEAMPVEIPSSPPLPLSKTEEYDPASPMISFIPTASSEYDPASPPDRSSPFLPFARPVSYTSRDSVIMEDDSPPCSPKTVPHAIPESPTIPAKNPRRAERREFIKLTSENASTIMARSKTAPHLGFPGAIPVLAPTTQYDEDLDLPRWEPSQQDAAEEEEEITPRGTEMRVARAPSLSTIPQSSSSPPTAPQFSRERTKSPMGPRPEPAQSTLKNAMALRRMNSEVNCHRSRGSRTYVRLGREASPLLPYIGSSGAEREESKDSLFDFDFESSTASVETTPGKNVCAMDEIDMEIFEKNVEGALKGFDAEFQEQQKENLGPNARRCSVWDDGEKYWEESRPSTCTSGGLFSAYTHATPTKRKEQVVTTSIDPRLLMTPATTGVRSSASMAATPKSLYDADGFLKA
ncbi:hypothetical protein AC578_6967 [Pseudocercospora eumusae]|uniref:Uncharacterized protein n=1 Tax=Pseudocercospora eumusae TaxID=321146 RepID=A0A139H9K0_9PEZI|nr:hypothetical protein AC578_6967 [Pseudocercospora eumusae]